jgi:hypothetical protein
VFLEKELVPKSRSKFGNYRKALNKLKLSECRADRNLRTRR